MCIEKEIISGTIEIEITRMREKVYAIIGIEIIEIAGIIGEEERGIETRTIGIIGTTEIIERGTIGIIESLWTTEISEELRITETTEIPEGIEGRTEIQEGIQEGTIEIIGGTEGERFEMHGTLSGIIERTEGVTEEGIEE